MGVRAFSALPARRQQAAAEAESSPPPTREVFRTFEELEAADIVHPNIIRTITRDMGFSKMTDVQMATINESLTGVDL